jgi:hypothetical protein
MYVFIKKKTPFGSVPILGLKTVVKLLKKVQGHDVEFENIVVEDLLKLETDEQKKPYSNNWIHFE